MLSKIADALHKYIYRLRARSNPNPRQAPDMDKGFSVSEIDNKLARHAHDKLYICEPSKNTGCNKHSCFINGGPCYMVHDKAYAKD